MGATGCYGGSERAYMVDVPAGIEDAGDLGWKESKADAD